MEITNVELLISQNNELLLRIYYVLLFSVGVTAAAFVLILLYKFIRLFF